ncbi:multiple sugar transport system permease protein [Deinococcus metalli]|uniref:Multiple sugar transport system permease protein n=1 Tax=Deinococcus metalli TaxID=1141878 RepID=A0A7W8KGJ5_9DEIO|nr:sugar ABC transporter permease [Deinococcus metalli]MBB5377695.1 multiple sugar transport system permease protein [Deinococcus metalli]GHF52616.1 sugar ABC transporter permease [Deinococcus metalli]
MLKTAPSRTTVLSPQKQVQVRKRWLTAALMVAPFVLIYLLFLIYPSLRVIQLSLTNADLTGVGRNVGLSNYTKLLREPTFYTALLGTLYFILLTVVPNTLVGLGLALLVMRLRRLRNVVLAAFFLPQVLPVSVVTSIWNWMLDSNFGLVNSVTGSTISWFQDPVWAMPAVALVTIWWTVGFNVLLFIAGLQNIAPDIYEAAALDGAAGWRMFRSITWPNLWPVTSLILLLQLIAQFKIFDQVYLLTGGGPFDKTLVLLLYSYREGFQQQHGGYASAIGVVLMVIILVVSGVQNRLLNRGER